MNILAVIFNSEVAATVLARLRRRGEDYAAGIAREEGLTLSAVQKQLARFERIGLLTLREIGKTRLYAFNPASPRTPPITALLKIPAAEPAPPPKRKKSRPRRPKPAEKNEVPPPPEPEEELWRY